MSDIKFLEGERILLRPLEEKDLNKTYLQWLNDEEVCQFNSHAIFPYTLERMQAYYNSLKLNYQSDVVLAIINKSNTEHVGNICLQSIDWIARNAEFAILLGNKEYWGKGIAQEAGLLICDYGFKRLNLHRIYCGTSARNTGMQKLATKLRMKQEGIRRESMFKNGAYMDIVEYGVLKKEFYNTQF
ncbi:GNAT family N-acetyltransferase [Flavisolibacter ginsengisoli]|jgi:RimJ/RimL family protein N-acetyltransferase|uniref:Protein N-acetyltransferase, RimJ/RimL family n=1 Tax=Flavisolibacter ginsengisoli DSM 18119 TaxID=1121884 RepID=A0A1M4VGW2_9BACT|nr:GNAT family protein [Flavisolibacter ginsengisoli]SHE68142.1 Protein N-acetyltransferase, RimJ/RimL family [Flavisolibacter ginsengisoli DSM 18119]